MGRRDLALVREHIRAWWIQSPYAEMLLQYAAKYPFLGAGRNRAGFLVGKWEVVKVPTRPVGEADNLSEATCYQCWSRRDRSRYAKCKVFHEGEMCLLRMERVKIAYPRGLPRWVDFIDCSQVGYNKNGVLKAYDYGCH